MLYFHVCLSRLDSLFKLDAILQLFIVVPFEYKRYCYQPLCHSYLSFPVIYFYLIHNKIRAHFSISTCLHFSNFSFALSFLQFFSSFILNNFSIHPKQHSAFGVCSCLFIHNNERERICFCTKIFSSPSHVFAPLYIFFISLCNQMKCNKFPPNGLHFAFKNISGTTYHSPSSSR